MQGPRAIKPREIDSLMELLNLVFCSDPARARMQQLTPTHFVPENFPNLVAMFDGRLPVAHAGVTLRDLVLHGTRVRTGLIGAVATHPEWRGKGLASRIMDHLVRRDTRNGVDLYLISGGRGLYHRLGAEDAGVLSRYRLSLSVLSRLFPAAQRATVKSAQPSDIKGMAGINAAEPCHVVRDTSEYQLIMKHGWCSGQRAGFYKVLVSGGMAAYLVCTVWKEKKRSCLRLMEYAGSRPAILSALPALARKFGASSVSLDVPPTDKTMADLMELFKVTPETSVGFDGTVAILNVPRLMERFRPWIEQRIGKAQADKLKFPGHGRSLDVVYGKERFVCRDRNLVVQIIFGNVKSRGKRAYPAKGELREIFKRIFPLPLIDSGISYV